MPPRVQSCPGRPTAVRTRVSSLLNLAAELAPRPFLIRISHCCERHLRARLTLFLIRRSVRASFGQSDREVAKARKRVPSGALFTWARVCAAPLPASARLTVAAGSDNPPRRNHEGCEQPMQPIRNRLILAALGLALAAPLAAQETPRPRPTQPAARRARGPAAPAAEAPAAPAAAGARGPAAAAPAAPAGAAPAGAAAAPRRRQPGQARGDGDRQGHLRRLAGALRAGRQRVLHVPARASTQAKNPVAEVSILKLPEQPEADAGVTVVTPLGTLLDHRRRACRSTPARSGSIRSPGAARSAASRASG